MGHQLLFVEAAGTLRVHPAGLVEVDLRGDARIEGRGGVDPFAATQGEEGALLADLAPDPVQLVL